MMVGFSGEGSRSMFAILDTYIGRPAHLGSHQSCNERREGGCGDQREETLRQSYRISNVDIVDLT